MVLRGSCRDGEEGGEEETRVFCKAHACNVHVCKMAAAMAEEEKICKREVECSELRREDLFLSV